jgi:hypothetical protein
MSKDNKPEAEAKLDAVMKSIEHRSHPYNYEDEEDEQDLDEIHSNEDHIGFGHRLGDAALKPVFSKSVAPLL